MSISQKWYVWYFKNRAETKNKENCGKTGYPDILLLLWANP